MVQRQYGYPNAHEYKAEQVALYNDRKAKTQLQILIVGCGLGGLAAAYALGQAGHNITVLESSPAIGEVGAGIQVGPNLSRLLRKWGLERVLNDIAENDKPSWFTFHRYSTGEIVGMSRLEGKLDRAYGAPWHVLHRADLYGMLFSIASPYIKLRLNSKVIHLETESIHRPSVTLQTGEVISADLIVGADGINSTIRGYITNQSIVAPTEDVAYRVILPTHTFLSDPQLKALIEEPTISCWMGPGRHIVGYCIRDRKEYNLVLVKRGEADTHSWTEKGDPEEMRAGFSGWEPRVQKLLSRADSVLKSKLVICQPLKTWIHESGRVALLGDSCHPMLPYRAQGSAMAIEDAAVLGNLFSRISHPSQIPRVLKAYEELRRPRATATQEASKSNRSVYHLPDGIRQEMRDAEMGVAMMHELLSQEWVRGAKETTLDNSNRGNPNGWSDREKNGTQFGYDPDEAVEDWWSFNM
ncbi:hypothetical protein D9757_003487 [Collybiopsis confluens]|uniref:FAD-binding domain-containing protein n=1 Tax=Collybiopsis confluens TaxID=2823264 RepID=A0A8H5HTH5_9AGAR|nr:hypothetical protein D9757_003487 [Collybiopsis confluens]